MKQIYLIAAVGRHGQLGLGGRLPWRDPEDLRFFKMMTTGGQVIVGRGTIDQLPMLHGRKVLVDNKAFTPEAFLEEHTDADSPVWIAGGAKTYARYMHLIRRFFVTKVDFDGDADVWMPPLWQQPSHLQQL